jgi:hypothetical protein
MMEVSRACPTAGFGLSWATPSAATAVTSISPASPSACSAASWAGVTLHHQPPPQKKTRWRFPWTTCLRITGIFRLDTVGSFVLLTALLSTWCCARVGGRVSSEVDEDENSPGLESSESIRLFLHLAIELSKIADVKRTPKLRLLSANS